jgi:hypothetical protein
MLQELPLSKQSFRAIRSEGFLYVDKTEYIWRMARVSKQYFLSRPRRFGKSLTCETLQSLFLGQKQLFEGLWIYDNWDWSKEYPVLHIRFNKIGYLENGLVFALNDLINDFAKEHGITLEKEGYSQRFKELITKLWTEGRGVVVLVDEYDKPLIDYLNQDDLHTAKENQQILKTFYSVLKGSEDYLRFLLITGVSKFSRVSVFSDLNHLTDISMHQHFVALTGYTQQEVENNFNPHLLDAAMKEGLDVPTLIQKIKIWYDGYTWDGKTHVYNPFSFMSFLDSGYFLNYWFKTGTPTFLIRLLKQQNIYDFENIEATSIIFDSYDVDNLEPVPLLFQTGYLTIKSINKAKTRFVLGYPNQEVKESFVQYLLGAFSHRDASSVAPVIFRLQDAIQTHQLGDIKKAIDDMLESIPKDIFLANREAYYHSVIYLSFLYLGTLIEAETHSGEGHLDAAITLSDHIYLFEFKLDRTGSFALQYLIKQNYAARLRHKGLPITGIGVNFSSKTRKIDGWEFAVL